MESSPVTDRRSTTVPRNQPTNQVEINVVELVVERHNKDGFRLRAPSYQRPKSRVIRSFFRWIWYVMEQVSKITLPLEQFD